jgi:hypothetical protein
MTTDPAALLGSDDGSAERPLVQPSKTSYLFFSTISTEQGSVSKPLVRRAVEYTSTEELVNGISNVLAEILPSIPVEFAVLSTTPSLPDVKAIYVQNEILNVATGLSSVVNALREDMNQIKARLYDLTAANASEAVGPSEETLSSSADGDV